MLSELLLRKKDFPPVTALKDEHQLTPFASDIRAAYRRFMIELAGKHRAGAGGIDVVRTCSLSVENIIKYIFDSVNHLLGGSVRNPPAVVATAGFGRRELSPNSDVDILFLWKRRPGRVGTTMVGYMVRMMWDSGLKVSHSVQTIERLRKALSRDSNLETSLLDARWLCGDRSLRDELSFVKSFIRGSDGGRILQTKLDETKQRWMRYGNSYHILEPNVKESPGGLRDFQTIRWIGMALPWSGTIEGLYRLSMADKAEIDEIRRAFDFLLRTRNELHFVMQSSWDILSFDIQATVAKGLGYRGSGEFADIELFMKDYYARTRDIYHIIARFLDETSEGGSIRIIEGQLYKRLGTEGLSQFNLAVRKEKFEKEPLYPFFEQLKRGKRFSPSTERRLRKLYTGGRLSGKVLGRMKKSFIELLQMEGRKAEVLKSMHELGVLSVLFPPFAKLTCLKKHDVYHHYTADEHSLQAVRELESLEDKRTGVLPRIYEEVDEKLELIIATLLHDIGKVEKGAHSTHGARMAKTLLKDFPLTEKSKELIRFLIRNHLVLSHFSQRRDIESAETIREFVRVVKSKLNLKLLYLLTYADLRATGPAIWTGWKGDLLKNLYLRASEFLTEGGLADEYFKKKAEKLEKKVLSRISSESLRKEIQRHLSMLPRRYLFAVAPSSVREHVDMVKRVDGENAVVMFKTKRSFIELTVCTKDMPSRLSQLCGAISVNDFNILSANAFTRKDGVVIDIFHVVNFDGSKKVGNEVKERFSAFLNDVIEGRVDLVAAYRSHIKKWKRRFKYIPEECSVEFENELSADSTIIDITAGDRPGLLYDITNVLSGEGLDIVAARVTTRGKVAADSFYVRTAGGGKVDDLPFIKQLRKKLCSILVLK